MREQALWTAKNYLARGVSNVMRRFYSGSGGMYQEYRDGEIVEAVVCEEKDLKNGEMKEVEVGKGKVLLIKDAEGFHAIGHKCSHYGAQLCKGALGNGHVRCPWHGACFNYKTGDIEDFPGLDSIPKFEVSVDQGKVKVKARKTDLENPRRQKPMSNKSEDQRSFVIVGGGGASVTCAETLRQQGFRGKVTILSKDCNIAYDRPKLSKALSIKAEEIALRKQDYYNKYNIDFHTNSEVSSVNTSGNTVTLSNGKSMPFDKLLLATGASPRQATFIQNHELGNIHTLRTVEDGNMIAAKGKGKKVVIIGTSFIGLEVACFLRGKSESITVIGQSETVLQNCFGLLVGKRLQKEVRWVDSSYSHKGLVSRTERSIRISGVEVAAALVPHATSVSVVDLVEAPFQLALGKEVGNALKKLLEEKGIKFYFKNSVKEFIGADGVVTKAVLKDDTVLEADLCVIGIGVTPATDFLKTSDIGMTDRGFVNVSKLMKTNKDSVYAAGDITNFPLFMMNDDQVNVQHWQMAGQQGRIAALNMLDKGTEIKSVPYFWTVMFGKSLRYCGYGVGYDDITIHGDLDNLKFVAYYSKGPKVIAVASLNYDPIVSQAAEMFLSGQPFTKDDVKSDATAWTSKLT